MRLAIRHVTRYAYEPAALRLALRLRLWPSRHEAQRVEAWRVSVNGEEVTPLFSDAFGETTGLWHAHGGGAATEIVAEGVVSVDDAAGVVRGLDQGRALGVFLRGTPLTAPDEALRAFAEGVRSADGPLASLHALMHAVHEAVDYRAGVTESGTSAARALALGAGVCQDHAHVFISAARVLGLPARYVAGYLLARAPSEDPEAEPEHGPDLHETHAWAEAHVPGLGWVGFDPSNAVCPTDRYVRLCSGLDAAAAAPIRGSVTGEAAEEMEASVEIAPASAQAQSQQ